MPDFNLGNAGGGLGRLAAALGGGSSPGSTYGKAYDNELGLQSKLAQALATIEASGASARLHTLQGDEAQGQLDARRPEAMLGNVLTTNGIPTDEAGAVGNFLKTGQLGGKYRAPADGNGPVAPAPDWQDKLGAVARSLGNMQGAVALGGKNIEDVAKANAIGTNEERKGAVINGKLDPVRLAQAEYAGKGAAPFSFHEFGTGNNLTGQVDDQNGPAQNFAQYRNAETGNQKAGAAAHYAAADSSRASAAKSRAETDQVVNGPKGVLVQTENGPVFADPRSGRSVPVTNPDGTPVQGKGKDLNGEQANALTFATRMQAAHDLLNQFGTEGVTRGGNIKGLAEGVGHALPIVGEAAGDAAGALTNWTQSPKQQQVEQAKRDFVNAVLRRESGAAISMGEFKNADRQYFPQMGDSAQVISQKAAARERVIQGMFQAVPASRRPAAPVAQATQQAGGATGGWGGAPTGGQRNVQVSY